MNSPSPYCLPGRKSARLVAIALVGVLAGAAGTGCVSSRETVGVYASAAPRPVLVQSGSEFAMAQRVAAEHEGDFALQGSGDSMAPVYQSGTALVVHPTSFFMLRAGMPVVYVTRHGTTVAHVLIEKVERGWVVMGINNAEPDDDLVTPENLIGVVRQAFAAETTPHHESDPVAAEAAWGSGSPLTLLH